MSLLRLITLSGTYTFGRFLLDEGSARRVGLYLYNIQLSQDTDIHASGGIRTRNPSDQTAADIRLRSRGLGTGFNYRLPN
jgi:hypothetical protein